MVDTTTGKISPSLAVGAKVKGTKLGAKLVFLRETQEAGVAESVISSMDDEDQRMLKAVYDVGWYPIELYVRLIEAIVEVAANGNEQILDELGRHSAEKVAASYPSYYRSRQPLPVLERMVPVHRQLNEPGEMSVSRLGPTRVEILVKEPTSFPKMCRVARAFYRQTLELCGVANVRVEEPICSAEGQDHCRFLLSWT